MMIFRSEFGAFMIFYYICDRTDLFGESKRVSSINVVGWKSHGEKEGCETKKPFEGTLTEWPKRERERECVSE